MIEAYLPGSAFAGLCLVIFAATSLWRVAGVLASSLLRLSARNMQHLSELAAAAMMAQMASVIWRPAGTLVNLPVEVRLCVVALAIVAWLASGRNVLFGLMVSVGGVLIGAG